MPSHHLNQYWLIVNWTLRNKYQWNFNQNTKLFIHKMHLKVLSAKCRPFCPGGDELIEDYNSISKGTISLTYCCKDLVEYPFVKDIHWSPMNSHFWGPVMLSFEVYLLLAWKSCQVLVIWDVMIFLWCHCIGLVFLFFVYSYIFILNLTPSFNGLVKDNCNKRWETFKFGMWCNLYYRLYGHNLHSCGSLNACGAAPSSPAVGCWTTNFQVMK